VWALFVNHTSAAPEGVLLVTNVFKFTVVAGQVLFNVVLLKTGAKDPALHSVPKV
jgi:hypothetical protein